MDFYIQMGVAAFLAVLAHGNKQNWKKQAIKIIQEIKKAFPGDEEIQAALDAKTVAVKTPPAKL